MRILSHQRLWRDLLLADWSVQDIAERYGVTERTVRETVAQP
ncbi:helix-turn-helix domain-containing protein [Sphingomonas sp.]